MALWTCDGEHLMTKEDAWDEMEENLHISDFADYLSSYISFEELISWAITQPTFFDKFAHAIQGAYSDCFYSTYYEVEESETE